VLRVPLAKVVAMATWNPARQIKRETLGHLSAGAPADIAILRLESGTFGFVDMDNRRMPGDQRLTCEMTIKGGTVVYDLNGLSATSWQ
jgi:dihydroorotase